MFRSIYERIFEVRRKLSEPGAARSVVEVATGLLDEAERKSEEADRRLAHAERILQDTRHLHELLSYDFAGETHVCVDGLLVVTENKAIDHLNGKHRVRLVAQQDVAARPADSEQQIFPVFVHLAVPPSLATAVGRNQRFRFRLEGPISSPIVPRPR
jgi:hypothetical protein